MHPDLPSADSIQKASANTGAKEGISGLFQRSETPVRDKREVRRGRCNARTRTTEIRGRLGRTGRDRKRQKASGTD